jgi:hypothetical protein
LKPDRKLCEAIVALRPAPAFEHLIKAIREDATEALQACGGGLEGTPLFRAQGKYQALKQWLDAFDKARELIEKFK